MQSPVCPPVAPASASLLSSPPLALNNALGAPHLHASSACKPQIPPQGIEEGEENRGKDKGKERQKDAEKGDCESNFGLDVWPPENPDLRVKPACNIVPLNFPRASDTPRDGSPTSAPETPQSDLQNQLSAHSEEEFLRNVSPARALRRGNMVARGSVLGGAEGALDLSMVEPRYLELLRETQSYLDEGGDRHSENLSIGEDKRKNVPHNSLGLETDAPTSHPNSYSQLRPCGPSAQEQAHRPAQEIDCGPAHLVQDAHASVQSRVDRR